MPSRRSKTVTLFSSAARTETANSTKQKNRGYSGVRVRINVSAIAASPSVVFNIRGYTPAGVAYTILSSAAVTGTGDTILSVAPGLTAAANVTANALLPAAWDLQAVHGDGDSITYSAVAELFL